MKHMTVEPYRRSLASISRSALIGSRYAPSIFRQGPIVMACNSSRTSVDFRNHKRSVTRPPGAESPSCPQGVIVN